MAKASAFMIDNLLGNSEITNNTYLKKRECITPPSNNIETESITEFTRKNQSTPLFNINPRDDFLMHQYYAYYYASALSYQNPGLKVNTCSTSLNSSGSPSYSTTSSSNTSNNLSSIDFSPIQLAINRRELFNVQLDNTNQSFRDDQMETESYYESEDEDKENDPKLGSHAFKRLNERREKKEWICVTCHKIFDRPSLLQRHIRTHTGEKPHICDVCDKAFSTSSSLNTHRRIHSGEKPHECNICGKRFTASSNLYYHKLTHTTDKPHKCTKCSKSFSTPGDLRGHMHTHNGTWPFKCELCNRGFTKQTNLKNHMLTHTGAKPFNCNKCDKQFSLACNLKSHLKTHHGCEMKGESFYQDISQ